VDKGRITYYFVHAKRMPKIIFLTLLCVLENVLGIR